MVFSLRHVFTLLDISKCASFVALDHLESSRARLLSAWLPMGGDLGLYVPDEEVALTSSAYRLEAALERSVVELRTGTRPFRPGSDFGRFVLITN